MAFENAVDFLETIATKLNKERSFTLTHRGETYHVNHSPKVEFEVKLE